MEAPWGAGETPRSLHIISRRNSDDLSASGDNPLRLPRERARFYKPIFAASCKSLLRVASNCLTPHHRRGNIVGSCGILLAVLTSMNSSRATRFDLAAVATEDLTSPSSHFQVAISSHMDAHACKNLVKELQSVVNFFAGCVCLRNRVHSSSVALLQRVHSYRENYLSSERRGTCFTLSGTS